MGAAEPAGRLQTSTEPLVVRVRVDVPALEELLLRVARLAEDLPEVLGLTLDPVLVGPAKPWHGGRSLVVAGGSVRIGPPTARLAPGPRRMPSPL